MLRFLRSLSFALAAASLLAPAAANAATKKKAVYPTVSSISPRKLKIGDKLTVRGAHFKPGKGQSSVAWYHAGKPVVFTKADTATSTKLVITVPTKVAILLAKKDDKQTATQLRIRVVGSKMGQKWTQNSRSPIVSPAPLRVVGAAPTDLGDGTNRQPTPISNAPKSDGTAACIAAAALTPAADTDGDGLANGIELTYHLDPCDPDTDGDGLTDGYEYWSAQQLNATLHLNADSVPYPGKRPWPNPLDPTDANFDFDGDGLSLSQEFKLWKATKTGFPLVAYSDGTQNSGGPQPVVTQADADLDLNHNGNLTDDERDEDGDGLSNVVEMDTTGIVAWWTVNYKSEKPYIIRAFSELDATDPDTDGDGIPDGQDDQDNDGWTNYQEMELDRGRFGYRVQPFNPCLPDPHSPTCSRYLLAGADPWPPFDQSQQPGDAIPFSWSTGSYPTNPAPFPNTVNYADWVTQGKPSPPLPLTTLTGWWDPWPNQPWFTGAWDGTGGAA
jgi:hypothetical protein